MKTNKALTGMVQKAEDGVYSIIASTGDIDRDGERILPKSFRESLPNYLKNNPVVLGFHNYSDFAIGKAVGGRVTDDALELQIVFAETERGKEARYLYDNGFMNSFSVGFIPKDWQNDKEGVREYTKAELLEVSAVPVPANAAANMIRSVEAAGASVKYFKEAIERQAQEDQEDTDVDDTQEVYDNVDSREPDASQAVEPSSEKQKASKLQILYGRR